MVHVGGVQEVVLLLLEDIAGHEGDDWEEGGVGGEGYLEDGEGAVEDADEELDWE